MSFKTISALLRGAWLIDPEFAKAHLPIVQNLLSGKFKDLQLNSSISKEVYAISNTFNINNHHSDFNNAPSGSFAIIPVTGPILKHDNCGYAGSMTRATQTKAADAHKNISAIIFPMDSPGGMLGGTQTFADAIKNATKPTIAIINDGMSASAAYWLASQCDEIYVSRKTDRVGSIGVFLTLIDRTKLFKKAGIKIHEIYANQSSEKNLDHKEALKGNYKPIQEDLDYLASVFIADVKLGRKDKINLSKGDPFKGKLYFADEALEIGLIDGIKTFDEVLKRADELTQQNRTNNNNSFNMNKENHGAITALIGVKSLESTKEGTFLNTEQMTIINKTLIADKSLISTEDHKKVVDELANATSENKKNLMAISKILEIESNEKEDFNAKTVTAAITAKITELKSGSTAEPSATTEVGDIDAGGDDAMDEIRTRKYYKDAEEALINS